MSGRCSPILLGILIYPWCNEVLVVALLAALHVDCLRAFVVVHNLWNLFVSDLRRSESSDVDAVELYSRRGHSISHQGNMT